MRVNEFSSSVWLENPVTEELFSEIKKTCSGTFKKPTSNPELILFMFQCVCVSVLDGGPEQQWSLEANANLWASPLSENWFALQSGFGVHQLNCSRTGLDAS